MPCTGMKTTPEEVRQKQLEELMKKLKDKSVTLAKVNGKLTINGWESRSGWCDACAVRKLKVSGDQKVRQMLAEAEKTTVKVRGG